MIHMTLCPNCQTIQKAGCACPLCKYPITARVENQARVGHTFTVVIVEDLEREQRRMTLMAQAVPEDES